MSDAPSDAPQEAASAAPQPTNVPYRDAQVANTRDNTEGQSSNTQTTNTARPHPKLRFKIHDLAHEGAVRFFQHANPGNILTDAITTVMRELYLGAMPVPPVRSITLILESFDGVAYTRGMDLDDDHKEIHFSLDYIAGIDGRRPERIRDEIRGVIVHEMVHVWQWNGKGTCPGGLIEGIADFVRLQARLAPPHWQRQKGGDWDAGYERTGFFLDWLEKKYGYGTVIAMNELLRDEKYEEKRFWNGVLRHPVSELWEAYQASLNSTS